MIKVKDATYLKDYTIRLVFNDNTIRDVDFGVFLKKRYPVSICNKNLDLDNFRNFKIEQGNIVWGKNWDLIFPEQQLYNGKIL
jgi:hypothetical protein